MFTTCQVKKNVTYIYIYIFGKTICWDLFFTENTSTLSSSRPLTRAMNSIKSETKHLLNTILQIN